MLDKKVLILEDNDELRELIKDHIQYLQIQVKTASSLEQAQKLIQSVDGRFDIIISDLILDGHPHGLELVRWTRSLENTFKSKSRFILMTGYHSDFDEKIAQKYGVNLFLAKPFDPLLLEEHLQTLLKSIETKAA